MKILNGCSLVIALVAMAESAYGQQLADNAEMRKLIDTFQGTWAITETYEPSEWMPNGGVGHGKVVTRTGPGGLSSIEEYRSQTVGGKTIGLSVTWWDVQAKGYRALWCVNTNPAGCIIMTKLAKWEDGDFVLGDETEVMGKKVVFKEVVSDISPNSYTQTLYQGASEGDLKRLMTVKATRSKTGRMAASRRSKE